MSDTQKISQTVERPAATGDGGLMLLVALALLGLGVATAQVGGLLGGLGGLMIAAGVLTITGL